jgi:predicted MFS family arabinose efflux permease
LPSDVDHSVRHRDLRWRLSFAVTLLLAMGAGTFMQFSVGVLAPFLTDDLALSRTQLGSLLTVFFAVGATGSLFAGKLVDRFGGRAMVVAIFALSGVSVAGAGFAIDYPTLILAIAVAGMATALINPGTNQLIAVHLPRGEQGVLLGIKQSGVQVAATVCGALLPVAAETFGWRGAMMFSGAVLLLGVGATLLVVPAPRGSSGVQRPSSEAPAGGFVAWMAAYGFIMGVGTAAVLSFVVLYAVEILEFSRTRAGLVTALIGAVSVVARVWWGLAAERMRTSTAPLLVVAALSVVGQVMIWGAQSMGEWVLWTGAIVFGATAASWNAVGMLAIVRELDPGVTGHATGIVQSAFYAGLLVCPIVFGWSVDVTGAYDAGWAGVTVAFIAATALVAAWHATHGRPGGTHNG